LIGRWIEFSWTIRDRSVAINNFSYPINEECINEEE
jgi:hypothetical protein